MRKTTKWLLAGLAAIGALGAISGISIAVIKANKGASPTPEASSSSSEVIPSSTSESVNDSTGGSESSSSGSAEYQEGAYISCDLTSINLTMSEKDTTYPEATFTATIFNADTSISSYASTRLGIVFEDTQVNDYFSFQTLSSTGQWATDSSTGSHVIVSGSPVKLLQKKKAPLVGGWSAHIYVVSPYYDRATVKWPILISLTTTA